MADNTVFDSAFKTMAHKAPQLLVPFINEAFDRSYPLDSAVVQYSNEHEGPAGSTVSDSVFRLCDKIYHVECQSTPDSDMVVRMIEYDFAIALEGALGAGPPYEMDFPESCVLFLRHAGETPDSLTMRVNLPGGDSFDYSTRVVEAQRFTCDEIFEKRLLLLLPYYLMRYEGALGAIESDDGRTAELLAECADLRARLEGATLAAGEPLLYKQLTELIMRVCDHLFRAHDGLRRKVRRTMGGEVWELTDERLERVEREARQEGVEEGLEQGLEQGIERAIARLEEAGLADAASLLSGARDGLRGKMRRTMGGEAWELTDERLERVEREARQEGVEEGLERAIAKLEKAGFTDAASLLAQR